MKLVIRSILIGAAALVGIGCTTIKTNELSPEEAAALKDKSVVLSKRNKLPDFAAQTAVNVQFGLLGVATAIANGNAMLKNNNIVDPAVAISNQLAAGMMADHNIKVIDSSSYSSADSNISDIVGLHRDYDLVLDVRTVYWNSIYFPSDWDNYRVMYMAHARLIDVKSKEVVAEEMCKHVPTYEDTNQAPSYQQLEDGTGLNESLAKSVEYCVEHVRSMTKLYSKADKENLAVIE